MPQSEYQIPQRPYENENFLQHENNVVDFCAYREKIKENEYTANATAALSAAYATYELYNNGQVPDRLADLEVNPVSAGLYIINEDLEGARQNHLDSARTHHAYFKTEATRSIIKVLFNRELSPNYDLILTDRELKNEESKIGAGIFGPVAPNEIRVFFNDNRESWFFYQEKTDSDGKKHSITLHYEVRPDGVYRIDTKDGLKCELVTGQELENFVNAAKIYHQRVMSQIYNKPIKQMHNQLIEQNDKIAA